MAEIPCFGVTQIEAVCKVLADTEKGLKGDEIGYILADMQLADPAAGTTKWKRLFNAIVNAQNKHQFGNHLIMFINRAMKLERYISSPNLFNWRRDGLNVALAFASYSVRDDGKVIHTEKATSLSEALARATQLKNSLVSRGTHSEVLKYCREELLEENYFHAVLEAVKGLAERIRQLSHLSVDGAELVAQAFSVKAPMIAFNALKTDSELSEHKGICNLLIGIFGAIRNPLAHAPKLMWAMPEQDAIDILAMLSFVHRKLDTSISHIAPAKII
jgi:uncharacterized protein (TIGR02391 family)